MLSRFITDLEGMGLDSNQVAILANIASIEPECTVEDCLKCEAKRFLECVLGGGDDFS